MPWDPVVPAFHVVPARDSAEQPPQHFGHGFVYYVGSHERCGCGFQGADPSLAHHPDEAATSQACLAHFAAYLENLRSRVGVVWLFSAESDDCQAVPETSIRIAPSALREPSFYFRNRELAEVCLLVAFYEGPSVK